MNTFALFSVSFSAILFAILVPGLEVNDTHLLNPEWPSHARLHEAWQLICNAAISVVSVWLVFSKKSLLMGIVLALIINMSFLMAVGLSDLYGGSMLHSDGSQMAVGGMNLAVLAVLVSTVLLMISALSLSRHPKSRPL